MGATLNTTTTNSVGELADHAVAAGVVLKIGQLRVPTGAHTILTVQGAGPRLAVHLFRSEADQVLAEVADISGQVRDLATSDYSDLILKGTWQGIPVVVYLPQGVTA